MQIHETVCPCQANSLAQTMRAYPKATGCRANCLFLKAAMINILEETYGSRPPQPLDLFLIYRITVKIYCSLSIWLILLWHGVALLHEVDKPLTYTFSVQDAILAQCNILVS